MQTQNKKTFCAEIIIPNEPLLIEFRFAWKLLGNNSSFSEFRVNPFLSSHFIVCFYLRSISHMFQNFLIRSRPVLKYAMYTAIN